MYIHLLKRKNPEAAPRTLNCMWCGKAVPQVKKTDLVAVVTGHTECAECLFAFHIQQTRLRDSCAADKNTPQNKGKDHGY